MVTSGLNSFLGFIPNGKVHEGGDHCAPSRPGKGGGGGWLSPVRETPKPFKSGGGGGGGGGGGIAPLEGSGGGGGGSGIWCGPAASSGTTDASPHVDGRKPGGKEPYW